MILNRKNWFRFKFNTLYTIIKKRLMSNLDIEANGWQEFQEVTITSHFDGNEISSNGWKIIEYDIPYGNVATYFPESNVLIPLESVADGSNTPTSKSVIVTIEPMN